MVRLPSEQNNPPPNPSTKPLGGKGTLLGKAMPKIFTIGSILMGIGQYVLPDDKDDPFAASLPDNVLQLRHLFGHELTVFERARDEHPHFDMRDDAVAAHADGRMQVRSLIEAVSYLSGTAMEDQETGITHDFRDRGDILVSEVMLPRYIPETLTREEMWNSYNHVERDTVGTALANQMTLVLPSELTLAQNRALLESYLSNYVDNEGMLVEYSIHDKRAEYGAFAPYAYVVAPLRRMNRDGEWSQRQTPAWVNYQEGVDGDFYRNDEWERAWFQAVAKFREAYATDEQREIWNNFAATLPDQNSVDGVEAWEEIQTHPIVATLEPPSATSIDHLEEWQAGGARLEPENWAFNQVISERTALPTLPYQVHFVGNGGQHGVLGTIPQSVDGNTIRVPSLVELIAYQHGITLSPSYGRERYDFQDRGDIIVNGIVASDNAPTWLTEDQDRARLWGSLSGSTMDQDAILAATMTIALPNLPPDELQTLVEEHLQQTLVSQGLIADYSIHHAYDVGGVWSPHAHVFVPTRMLDTSIDPDGMWGVVHPEWNDLSATADGLRSSWDALQEDYGIEILQEESQLSVEYDFIPTHHVIEHKSLDNSLHSEQVAQQPDTSETNTHDDQIRVQLLEHMPDNLVTLHEASEAFLTGSFAQSYEGSIEVAPGTTLLPEGIDERFANDPQYPWAMLSAHVDSDLDALIQHHFLINLPSNASLETQHQLVQDFLQDVFTDQNLVAHYVIHPVHSPTQFDVDSMASREHRLVVEGVIGDDGERTLITLPGEMYQHAHVAVPIYPLLSDGTFADTPHENWNNRDTYLEWRQEWADRWDYFMQNLEQESTYPDGREVLEHDPSVPEEQELPHQLPHNVWDDSQVVTPEAYFQELEHIVAAMQPEGRFFNEMKQATETHEQAILWEAEAALAYDNGMSLEADAAVME